MRRQALVLVALAFAAILPACSTRSETCLSGAQGCEQAPMCDGMRFTCAGDTLYAGTLAGLPGGLDLIDAEGTSGDYVLQNGSITVVFDALNEPHDLAPTGGNIIDMGARGGEDDIVLIYQLANILPDDALAYDEVEVIDRSPELVALVMRGTLDGRPDIEVVTRYELRACEPGLRVRTELYNGSARAHTLTLVDAPHWGKRNALPFSPLPGEGFSDKGFGLTTLQADFAHYDFVMARAAEEDAPTYGLVRCDRPQLRGVNSTELSALGTGIGLIRPGELRSYERFLSVTQSRDLDEGTRLIAGIRRVLHGDVEPVTVSGDITAGGLPMEGSLRRSTILFSEIVGNDLHRPLTTVIPDAEGHFEAVVPSRSWLWYEVWSFGRVVASGVVPRGEAPNLGTIEIPMPARLSVSVTGDGEPAHASLFVTVADADEASALRGTYLREFRECSPWLGSPVGASPACNIVNLEPAGTDFELPAGNYQLWFSAGPEWSLARVDIEIAAGEVEAVTADLSSLDVRPSGWLSADLHVHGKGSFDSSLPDLDRVRTFVAHGVDVIASTDHDFVSDYAQAVDELGLSDRVVVMGGLETTPLIPFLDVPEDDLPKVIGHFNHWPITPNPEAPRGGAPWDELVEPGELYDRLQPSMGPEGIHMLNHPWDETQFGRDLGFLRAIGFDPREPIPSIEDGSANGMLMRESASGTRNIDFQVIEVQNGASAVQALKTRPLWFSLISQGHVRAGVGNSDSHELHERLGFGRTYVDAGPSLADFDVARFNGALKEGKATSGNGVVVIISLGPEAGERRTQGFAPYQPSAGDTLQIEVRAPPWIPVDEVRLITAEGTTVLASGDDLLVPPDPLGSAGVVRYQESFDLASLIDPGSDNWLLVEAGMAFQPTADLNDDGVPDTSDNNGDGVVDETDIEEGEDDGPLESPADPIDESDPRYSMSRVLPGAWPYGFTNPILIDWQGDGWQAPGLRGTP